jgi:hypothetical protein
MCPLVALACIGARRDAKALSKRPFGRGPGRTSSRRRDDQSTRPRAGYEGVRGTGPAARRVVACRERLRPLHSRGRRRRSHVGRQQPRWRNGVLVSGAPAARVRSYAAQSRAPSGVRWGCVRAFHVSPRSASDTGASYRRGRRLPTVMVRQPVPRVREIYRRRVLRALAAIAPDDAERSCGVIWRQNASRRPPVRAQDAAALGAALRRALSGSGLNGSVRRFRARTWQGPAGAQRSEHRRPCCDVIPWGASPKEEDVEVGLAYFGARYLSLGLGRWMSADPATSHGVRGVRIRMRMSRGG